jgi:L-iditol 2-dehydrogenase
VKALFKMHAGEDGMLFRTDAPVPEPQPDEIRIKIYYTGICGTDLHIMRDEFNCFPPLIIGHEFSGIVDSLGNDVKGFKKGDRVVSMTAAGFCGECEYCRKGLLMLCPEKRGLGSGYNGAFAEYMVMKADRVFLLPKTISMQEAALCEPIACTIRATIERALVKPGDFVYVSGPGAIGQLVAQLAKISGAHISVGGVDKDIERLGLAQELGADKIINVSKEDVGARAAEITGGAMYNVVFECAGTASSAATCLDIVKKTGKYNQVGLFGKSVPFDMDKALFKELDISNSYSAERTSWVILMRILNLNRLKIRPLISKILPLEAWKKGFKMADNKEGYKILLQCSEDARD